MFDLSQPEVCLFDELEGPVLLKHFAPSRRGAGKNNQYKCDHCQTGGGMTEQLTAGSFHKRTTETPEIGYFSKDTPVLSDGQ